MALRLVLVGVVASLGLTLPSREALDTWTRSGQAWMNARLAEWESRRPVDESAYVYVADAVEPTRTLVTTDSEASGELALKSLVDEWAEFAKKSPVHGTVLPVADDTSYWFSLANLEAIYETPAPGVASVAIESPKSIPTDLSNEWEVELAAAESWHTFFKSAPVAPMKGSDLSKEWEVELVVAEGWNAFFQSVPAAPAKPAIDRAVVAQNFRSAFARASAALAQLHAKAVAAGRNLEAAREGAEAEARDRENLEVARKAAEAKARDREFELAMDEMTASFSVTVPPAPVAAKTADLNGDFDRAVDEMIATFSKDREAAEAAKQLAARERERAAWLEEVELADAYEVVDVKAASRALAGVGALSTDVLVAAKTKAAAPGEPSRLANAVRLTREAVNAWASLLHGPAVVTISR